MNGAVTRDVATSGASSWCPCGYTRGTYIHPPAIWDLYKVQCMHEAGFVPVLMIPEKSGREIRRHCCGTLCWCPPPLRRSGQTQGQRTLPDLRAGRPYLRADRPYLRLHLLRTPHHWMRAARTSPRRLQLRTHLTRAGQCCMHGTRPSGMRCATARASMRSSRSRRC